VKCLPIRTPDKAEEGSSLKHKSKLLKSSLTLNCDFLRLASYLRIRNWSQDECYGDECHGDVFTNLASEVERPQEVNDHQPKYYHTDHGENWTEPRGYAPMVGEPGDRRDVWWGTWVGNLGTWGEPGNLGRNLGKEPGDKEPGDRRDVH